MEAKGFERMGKAVLLGFVIFALVVIWVVNSYFIGNRDNEKNIRDTAMGHAISQDTNRLDRVITGMYENLFAQKEWLETIYEKEWAMSSDVNLMDLIMYSADNNISTLDGQTFGNLIFQGQKSQLTEDVRFEINQMESYYALQRILYEQLDFEMTSVYYSKNKFACYYPYFELGNIASDYNDLFSSVDKLIEQLKTIQSTDSQFNVDRGWDSTSTTEDGKLLSFSTAIPVIDNFQIVGILNGSVSQDAFNEVFMYSNYGQDLYVLDKDEKVIYTNKQGVWVNENIQEVIAGNYKNLKYYTNKFPIDFEIRDAKDHTLYVTTLSQEGTVLLYVVDKKNTEKAIKLVLLNVLMFSILLGIIYYTLVYTKQKRDHIENLIKKSSFDGMTELLNHKNILEALKRNIKNRRVRKLSILMLDIDNFKMVNDTYGHGIGDDVIKICAQTIKECTEGLSGACGRYGGEEFLVVINHLDLDHGISLANQIREKIHENIDQVMGIQVTISIGLHFVKKPNSSTIEELVDYADKNLYQAKHSGKNRVISNDAQKKVEN